MTRNKPNKPSSPIGVISFLQKGSVNKVVEQLPTEQDKVEETIVTRFIDNLKDREINSLVQNEENDIDFTCQEIFGKEKIKWEIELTEFFIKEWRMLDISRIAYFEELIKVFRKQKWIENHSILISDGYVSLPNINKQSGQYLLKSIIETIENLEERFKETADGVFRVIDLEHNCSIHFIKNPDKNKTFGFYNAYPASPTGFNNLMINTIDKKLKKNYAKPEGVRKMLLCYSTQNLFQIDDTIKTYVNSKNDNQFDEIWYSHPLPMDRPSSNTQIL